MATIIANTVADKTGAYPTFGNMLSIIVLILISRLIWFITNTHLRVTFQCY